MKKSATTRAVVFGTVHREATLLLMDLLEASGIVSYVGKVNMDRDAPESLREPSADASAFDTFGFINAAARRRYQHTMLILTPRFIPSCSNALLNELSEVRRTYDLPVQSHLSENPEEVELVKRLMPEAEFYGDGYDRFGLFGGQTESMFRAITDAIQVSKLLWRYLDPSAIPLSFAESFYLATKGGGSFFGRVGSFERNYEFDAVVLDDSRVPHPRKLSLAERLERAVYLCLDRDGILAKYVRGRRTEGFSGEWPAGNPDETVKEIG